MDDTVFIKWVDDYTEDLYKWALMKVSDPSTSEDLVQDTFIAAYKARFSFKGKASPKTWLISILRNKIVDFYRANSKNKKIISLESEFLNTDRNFFGRDGHWLEHLPDYDWDREDLFEDSSFLEVIRRCIAALPNRSALAIRYKYLEEMDGKAICKELDLTSSNYWQIIHRSKLQLKGCLEQKWFKKVN